MARKKLLTEGEVRQFMKLASLGGLTETYLSNNPLEERDEEEELEDELHATEDELGAEDHLADEEGDELDAEMDLGGAEDNEELLARVVQAVANELGVEVDVEGAGDEGGEELEVDAELEEPLGGDEELELGAEEEIELPGGRDMYQEGEGSKKGEYKRRDKDGKVGHRAGDVDHHYKDYEDDTGEKKGDESSTHPGRKDYLKEAEPAHDAEVADDDDAEELRRARERAQAAKQRQRDRRGRGVKIPGVTSEELDQEAIVAEVAQRVAARLSADKQREELAAQLAERIFTRLTAK